MSIKPGDIIDEAKNHPQSCQAVLKVIVGGAGFETVECCGNNLNDNDTVDSVESGQRASGDVAKGTIIDESKNHPNSCGLKVEVVEGGAGLSSIKCCGNTLTIENDSV